MKDEEGRVLYVGKALNLRRRVRSYFSESAGRREFRPAARRLGTQAAAVDFVATRNEHEAFILESNLIKKFKPPFNIRLKDDKRYLSIKVDLKHPFPALMPVRKPRRDGSLYFGPYTSARALRAALRLIRTVAPLRSCSDREFRNRSRPCLQYEIGRCPAPCSGRIDEGGYRIHLERALSILRGGTDELFRALQEEMAGAAARMEYERAARLRDAITGLELFTRTQRVENPRWKEMDVVGMAGGAREGFIAVAVLPFRGGKLQEVRSYTFSVAREEGELLEEFLLRYYGEGHTIPERLLLPVAVPEGEGMEAFLRERRGAPFRLSVSPRGEGGRLLLLARENARFVLHASLRAREEAVRTAGRLQTQLRLPRPPRAIECVDVSTTGGREAVGAVVRFEEGEPVKHRYRRYRIRTVAGMDDFAMIREVVRRRFRRGRREEELPDLFMVDGGKGQVAVAADEMARLGLGALPVVGLRKGVTRAKAVTLQGMEDDRVVLPGAGVTGVVPSGSPELYLLQRIRDEAHRFAVTYHRKRRSRAQQASPLDGISGLGAARRKALLTRFGGLRALRRAAPAEIEGVPGIGPTLAERIHRALHD